MFGQMNPERYKKKLKTHLDGELYRHSLGVAETAAGLAGRYGADRRKAYLAGLVHDFGKGYPTAWLRRKAVLLGLRLDRVTAVEARLLHAPVGAALLPGKLGIKDPAIIRAVAFHTTGRSGMTLLEKIVYLADLIEPERSYPGVAELRLSARFSLEEAILAAVERTICSVLERGLLLHPRSIELRNSLLDGSKKNGGKK